MLRKKVYVVLGMSRSGTSALTRGLQALGVYLGNKLIPPGPQNLKGFFEDKEVMFKINRRLSVLFNQEWLEMTSENLHNILNHKNIQAYKNIALELLEKRLSLTGSWCFKDPRIDALLPFWRDVFLQANISDHYIIAVRNPLAIAHSNNSFFKLEQETALIIWLKHMIAAIGGSINKPRIVVAYENLVKDPTVQLKRIYSAFKMDNELNHEELSTFTNEFIDNSLNHHPFDLDDIKKHAVTKVVPLCVTMYEFLQKLANDEITFDDNDFQREWMQILNSYKNLAPVYNYIEHLVKINKEQQRQVRKMKKLLSWKIIFPLRWIESLLRGSKRKILNRKRLINYAL